MIALVAALGLTATRALSSSSGPYPALSGVPAGPGVDAEQTCVACHVSFPLNADDRAHLALTGLPERYEPGERYALRFEIRSDEPGVQRWGFQVTAVDRATLHGAGTFEVTDPQTTQLVEGGPADRTYIEHAYGGTGVGEVGGFGWPFAWTAPSKDVGAVAFYASANTANADGSQMGDRIYNRAPAPLAVVEGPPGSPTAPGDAAPPRGARAECRDGDPHGSECRE